MRYKSLSPFVRNAPPPETPGIPTAGEPDHPTARRLTVSVLIFVMVLAPIGYLSAEGDSLRGNTPRAHAANANGKGHDKSQPPGHARRSPGPTPTSTASTAPTAAPASVAPSPTTAPTTAPTPSPTLAATPTPAPSATQYGGSHCSTSLSSAPDGWHRVMADSFAEDIPLGEWGKPGGTWEFPGGMWRARPAGWLDSSGRGTYNSMKTTSQHDGLLDVWVHSEGSTRYVAAPIPLVGDTTGQRITLCMRADEIPGYKVAFLLWPNQGPGNYHGEINFPEGRLLTSASAHAFMHYDPKPSSGKVQDAYDTNQAVQQWHAMTIEWNPWTQTVSFLEDGRLVGRSQSAEVPDGPMHYVMQIETYLASDPLPPPAAGHVLVDWFAIDVPN